MDDRDAQTWVAIELTKLGEDKIQDGSLPETIRQDLQVPDDFPVFVPAAFYPRGDRRVTVVLMEGYVFVAADLQDVKYFGLEEKPYVSNVLSIKGGAHQMRTVVTLPDTKISELRQRLRKLVTAEIPMGARVKVSGGTYRNLEGIVRGFVGEDVFVEIHLRSLQVVVALPRILLEILEPLAEKDISG